MTDNLIFVERISAGRGDEPLLCVFSKDIDSLKSVKDVMARAKTYGRYRVFDSLEDIGDIKHHLPDYHMIKLFGKKLGESWNELLPSWLIERLKVYTVKGRWYESKGPYNGRVYQFYDEFFSYQSSDPDPVPSWVHKIYDKFDIRRYYPEDFIY